MNIWLAEIWRAWRASLRRPGFLLLATGVLALGIGASVAVFTLIDNTLMRPLSVPQPSRLLVVGKFFSGEVAGISPHEYQYLAPLKGVSALGLMRGGSVTNIDAAGVPVQVPVVYVDRGVLPALGLHPVVGRNFNAREDHPQGPRVALLSYGLWQRQYGGKRAVVGRTLQVEGHTTTIVGVLPAAFNATLGVGAGGIVLPMALPAHSHNFNHNGQMAIARLAPGANMASVAAQADALERTMYRNMTMGGNWIHPQFGADHFATWRHHDARPMLLLFLGGAALVLLVALVNLTNLMLLRSLARRHDAAVRSALGASLLRRLMPALGEGLLVGLGAAQLGMLLAVVGLTALAQFIPVQWLHGGDMVITGADWALAFAVGMLGALLAAALGLWRSRGVAAGEALREGGRSGVGVRDGRLGRVLVVAQVAVAVMVLCAAGVIAHALYQAAQRPLGFSGHNVLTFELSPVKAEYPDQTSVHRLSQRLVQRLRTVPGVTTATVTTNLPVSAGPYGQFNNSVGTPASKKVVAQLHGVGPDFFNVFSIGLHAGRGVTRNDVHGGAAVVVISQDLADADYGGDAIGKSITVYGNGGLEWPMRIVGVVDSTYQRGPLEPMQPVVYLPLAQMPAALMKLFRHLEPLRFAVRVRGSSAAVRAAVRKVVAEVAPGQPIARMRPMRRIVRQTTADARLSMLLIGIFATLALLLAAAGLYAVMAVAVAAREREFGVRTALGASPGRLVRLVLRGGMFQIVTGLVIGIALALGFAQLLARWSVSLSMSLIGRISAFDPAVVVAVCVLLALSGLLACLLPALRAGRVEPMHALRGE